MLITLCGFCQKIWIIIKEHGTVIYVAIITLKSNTFENYIFKFLYYMPSSFFLWSAYGPLRANIACHRSLCRCLSPASSTYMVFQIYDLKILRYHVFSIFVLVYAAESFLIYLIILSFCFHLPSKHARANVLFYILQRHV